MMTMSVMVMKMVMKVMEMMMMVMVMMMMVTHGETRVGGGSCPPLLAPHRSVAGRPPPNSELREFLQSLFCLSFYVGSLQSVFFCFEMSIFQAYSYPFKCHNQG